MQLPKKAAALVLSASLLTGCATGLNSMQEREYAALQQEGLLIEEKDPTLGAVLGILPGFGSFYVREPGYGIVNLLFWPLSVLWDPVSGYEGAKAINYDLTKYKLEKDKAAEIGKLDDQLVLKQISQEEYVIAKRQVEEKYTF